MFIKMIVLHKTGDGVKHFLWCVGLHGSFFIMREGVAVHVLFELIRSLPGIFFKCIIHNSGNPKIRSRSRYQSEKVHLSSAVLLH